MKTKSVQSPQKNAKETFLPDFLEQAKEILTDLESDLDKMKDFWLDIRVNNSGFEEVSEDNWRDKSSRCRLHGGTKLLEANELSGDVWGRFCITA